MKSIVHIVDSLAVGGRENLVVDLCNKLNKNKYKIYIILLSEDDLSISYKLDENIKLYTLPYKFNTKIGRLFFLFSFIKIKFQIESILIKIKPNIIHTHSFIHRLLIVSFSISKFKNDVSFFHTNHTSGLYYENIGLVNKIKLLIEKIALSLLKPSLVAISEIVQKNNIKSFNKCSKQSRYISNGIELSKFDRLNVSSNRANWNLDEKDIVISYVARLSDGKNHMTLLKSIKLLINEFKNIKLMLAGEGHFEDILKSFVLVNEMTDNVKFLGSINNVPELLFITDIGVSTSEYEGFGLTLIEMMSMEVPVIVSNNLVFKNFITHNKNGLIFSMFDSIDLSQCIRELILNKNLRSNLISNGKSFSQNFSFDKMVASYESYYELDYT